MADLKLVEIENSLRTDGELLYEARPEILTVMADAGAPAIRALRAALHRDTMLLAVTALTNFDDQSWGRLRNNQSIAEGVKRLAHEAAEGNADGLVLSGRELTVVRAMNLRIATFVVPDIRPIWSLVPDDDGKRSVTPTQAFAMGATHIVVGRPIVGAVPNADGRPQSVRDAAERTIEEIELILSV